MPKPQKPMQVSVWTNGKQTDPKRSFGVDVGKANRKAHFSNFWSTVTLIIDGTEHEASLAPNFWTTCPEIRCQGLNQWIKDKALTTWPPGNRPKLNLMPLGENRFELSRQ